MVYLLYPAVAIATAVVGAATYVWFQRPVIVLRLFIRLGLKKAGLLVKYKQFGGSTFCYAERGTPSPERSSIIFVHGFMAAKDAWQTIIQALPREQHVVAVDLLGHGETFVPAAFERASVEHIAESLHQCLSAAGLIKRPVHMIGTSMGGLVAALYAADHPDRIELLTLICPTVFTPILTRYRQELKGGRSQMLARSVEELLMSLELILFHKDKVPKNRQLLKGVLQLRENKMDFFTQLSKATSERNVTEDLTRELMSRIHRPTQIIWGENDELLHVSGAEYLRTLLSDCRRVDILSDCGHATAWDQPVRLTASIAAFRAGLTDTRL